MDLIIGIAIGIIGILAAAFLKSRTQAPAQEEQNDGSVDYTQAYQAKYLLTKNEWHEYKKLKQYATEKGLIICPKVRLLDIVEPRKGQNYRSLMGKIQSKHVDFLITDQDLRIKGVVELDDGSHDTQDRKDRDLFVDQVLQSVGYNVVRTRGVTAETLEKF